MHSRDILTNNADHNIKIIQYQHWTSKIKQRKRKNLEKRYNIIEY